MRALTVLLALTASACLAPPCPCASVPGTPAPLALEQPASSAGLPAPLVIWDGEGTAARGEGWASCEKESGCATSLEVKPGAGRGDSVGLLFAARGPEWMGFGWNWFSWWPPDAGTDVSTRKSLGLWIRVLAEPGKGPEPFTVRVALGGSAAGGKDASEAVPLLDFAPDFADGAWHEVRVPLGALLRGKGERFDLSRAWSLTIGAWNQGEREYRIAVDEIYFL